MPTRTATVPSLLAAAAALAAFQSAAQPARLHHLEGTLAFAPAGEREWLERLPARPLSPGDRFWFDRGSRGELQFGPAAVRLAGPAQLTVGTLDGRSPHLALERGTLEARLPQLRPGESFGLASPHLSFRPAAPGRYRLDVDPASQTTRVTVQSGSGVAYGQDGHVMTLAAGQQVTFSGRALRQVAAHPVRADGFEEWSSQRDRSEAAAQRARAAQRVAALKREQVVRVARASPAPQAPKAEAARPVTQAYALGGPAAAEHMAPADWHGQWQRR